MMFFTCQDLEYNWWESDFETNWFGLPSLNTQGDKNAPGALRTLNITSNGSTYQLIEKVIEEHFVSLIISQRWQYCSWPSLATIALLALSTKISSKPTVSLSRVSRPRTMTKSIILVPVLVPQAQGGGGYYGYWVSLDVKQTATPYQSIIVWGVSHCVIGNPFRKSFNVSSCIHLTLTISAFASFHENTIKSVTATLQSQGKIKGTNIGPYSVST